MVGFPLRTAVILIPALGAALIVVTPRTRPELVRVIGFTTSVAVLVVAGSTLYQFATGTAGFQFVSHHTWIKEWGISWHLGIDGISLFLVVLTAVLFPFALAGADPHHDVKAYTAWMLVLEAGCLGVFIALDLFLFFVFWEIVLVPMYFLIGGWGYERRVYAALKFFLYTMAGSALMLVAILALVFLTARQTGSLSFDLVFLARNQSLAATTARWLFLPFSFACAIKAALLPLHVAAGRAHRGAHRRVGHPRWCPAEARDVRVPALRPLSVPPRCCGSLAPVPDARCGRHHLRSARRDDAKGSQAPRRLLVGRPPRLHRVGHLRLHPAGPLGRPPPDGQPRALHWSAVPPRRVDLRAAPHASHRRAQRPAESGPGVRGRVHVRRA